VDNIGLRWAMRICEAYADEHANHVEDEPKRQAACEIMERLAAHLSTPRDARIGLNPKRCPAGMLVEVGLVCRHCGASDNSACQYERKFVR